jgi:hypothetical protein
MRSQFSQNKNRQHDFEVVCILTASVLAFYLKKISSQATKLRLLCFYRVTGFGEFGEFGEVGEFGEFGEFSSIEGSFT